MPQRLAGKGYRVEHEMLIWDYIKSLVIFYSGIVFYMSPIPTTVSVYHDMTLAVNPLPHMPIFGSSNSVAHQDMMSSVWTNRNMIL